MSREDIEVESEAGAVGGRVGGSGLHFWAKRCADITVRMEALRSETFLANPTHFEALLSLFN